MATVLLVLSAQQCFLRRRTRTYHLSADLTGPSQPISGVTIEADIIKQKLPGKNNGGYQALNMGGFQLRQSFDKAHLPPTFCSDHPIDLTRYQVANCYMGPVLA